jgi:transposase
MARRTYSREFKVSAVQLVQQQGYTVPQAAESLGVDAASVRYWVRKFGAEVPRAASGEAALRAENQQLRKENQRLLMEREILKKAAAFFARNQS